MTEKLVTGKIFSTRTRSYRALNPTPIYQVLKSALGSSKVQVSSSAMPVLNANLVKLLIELADYAVEELREFETGKKLDDRLVKRFFEERYNLQAMRTEKERIMKYLISFEKDLQMLQKDLSNLEEPSAIINKEKI